MNKTKWVVMTVTILVFAGCATLKEKVPLDVDRTAQSFFDDLQKSDNQDAYSLLGKGLSQRISFDQFDQFMQAIRDQWGRVISDDTEVMPFHRRTGEQNFVPLDVQPAQLKRYTFDVKFDDAEMNFDLTVAPEGGVYKIVWFSIWGSSIYLSPQIKEKIEQLFSVPDSAAAAQ